MARDLIDRVAEGADHQLDTGERWLAAQAMTVKGAKALRAWSAESELADLLPQRQERFASGTTLEVADGEVPNSFVAALTNRRLMIFDRSVTGRPRELVASHDLAAASLDVVDSGERVRSRIFVFAVGSDGRVFAGEAGINGRATESADDFVSAFRSAQEALGAV